MARASKSPKRVLMAAHRVAERTLQRHWHRFSPKKFTVPQLFACLVLKEFLQLDDRKLAALLVDAPSLAEAIGMTTVPHFTTFQKAAVRLLMARRVWRLIAAAIAPVQDMANKPTS